MISKIISGGQTGVDRAALDAAIQLGIPHGGSIPKGRKAEDGPISNHYKLKEMDTEEYAQRTEQNILDGDGTLIISRGKLTDGSELTRILAAEHKKPCLHIDLEKMNPFAGAKDIKSWIVQHDIKVMNVAGPRASKDPDIYELTLKILKVVFYMHTIETNMPEQGRIASTLPLTVDEAVDWLVSRMSLRDKMETAKLRANELSFLDASLGQYVRDRFGMGGENGSLMASCRIQSGLRDMDTNGASAFIVEKLWVRLRETHRLRLVHGSEQNG